MDDAVPAPREPRKSMMLMAYVAARDHAAPMPHRVVNLSRTGVCVADPQGLTAGEPVLVSIGEVQQRPAQVIWAGAAAAGLHFLEPIDIEIARRRRPGNPTPLKSGWFAELRSAYHRD